MRVSINPRYFVRNEKNCSYIVYAGNLIQVRAEEGPLVNPVPPFIGFLLSLFNGEELENTISKASQLLEMSEDKIRSFVNKLLNNEEAYVTSFKGERLYFPKTLLIESERNAKTYTMADTTPFEPFIVHRLSVPANVNVMITSKCHTNCVYCYADRSRKDDMKTTTILRLIDEAKKDGVVNVLPSGGDIFSNKDWRVILKKLSDSDYEPMLSTKIPLNEDDVAFLKEIDTKDIQYSIDSLDAGIVQKQLLVTGDEYVRKIKEALSFCDKYGLKVHVKTVLTKFNSTLENMEEMFRFLSQYKNVVSWNVIPAFCSSYREDYDTYKANKEQLESVSDYLNNLPSGFILHIDHLKDKLPSHKPFGTVSEFTRGNKGCTANSYSMSVFSNGKVSVCEMLYYNDTFYIGDVTKSSIRQVWESEKALAFYHFKEVATPNPESSCYSCSVVQSCKKGLLKKICYADIINTYGTQKWDYPDPRCPKAPKCDLERVM